MPTHIEAVAAIALTCFSSVNLESRMTPKIFNSETISTTEPSITIKSLKLHYKNFIIKKQKVLDNKLLEIT